MIELLLIAMLAVQAIPFVNPPAYTGTYQTVAVGNALIRTDTRTGSIEKCTLVGKELVCEPIAVAAK